MPMKPTKPYAEPTSNATIKRAIAHFTLALNNGTILRNKSVIGERHETRSNSTK